jgi:glucose-6-phosphate dehydrogenase assembly protein OpcA
MIRQHPDRVRSLDWHEPGVTLGEVLTELTRLHVRLGRHDAGDDEHPHPRNCVMNLVFIASTTDEAMRVQDAGAELSAHHPMRLLVLLLEPAHNATRVDAWIRSEAHELPGGMPIQFETVRLRVTGTSAEEPASLVEPLLVPDVPTYLWWHGTPPVADAPFRQVLQLVDSLIVDSASFERPFISTIELAELAVTEADHTGIFDLQWGRLRPWRETLAQFFTPADRRPYLGGINGLGIDYVGEGRGNRVGAALLTGWVSSMLHWTLRRAVAGQGGVVQAFFTAERGHPVEVSFRSVHADDLREGEVAAVRVEAAALGRTCAFAIERDLEHRGRARIQIDLGELDSYSEWRPMETPTEAELLVEMIPGGRRDAVYVDALQEAGQLLRAFR